MLHAIRAKKFLGQHFLRDENIARKIVASLTGFGQYQQILEIGPGTGILTKFLINNKVQWHGVELDRDSVAFLKEHYPVVAGNLYEQDFLKLSIAGVSGGQQMAIVGNFPYNISSQIVFKVIENRQIVPEMVGMFQKEMALRISAPHGNKIYGVLSVLTQAFYKVEYLFQVDEHVFHPPPKVKSAVIRLTRKESVPAFSDKKLFLVVKTAFNQRRKTLRNSLKGLNIDWTAFAAGFDGRRPEQIGLDDFIMLANQI